MTDMMHSFELFQPASMSEANSLLEKYGDKAWVLAGGKDSLDWFKDRHKRPEAVIDISGLKDLRGIADKGGHVSIGALTTLTEVEESDLLRQHFPVLTEAAGRVASPQIRNAGTIGGNVSQDIRDFIGRFVTAAQALSGLTRAAIGRDGDTGAAMVEAFERDSATILSVLRLVLARGNISSEMVDNTNGLIAMRAYLTSLFFIDKVLLAD